MSVHNGYRAAWNGTEYEASPDGQLVRLYTTTAVPGFEPVAPERFRKLVLLAELEWLRYVSTRARYRGDEVVILDVNAGRALIADRDSGPRWVRESELTEHLRQRLPAG